MGSCESYVEHLHWMRDRDTNLIYVVTSFSSPTWFGSRARLCPNDDSMGSCHCKGICESQLMEDQSADGHDLIRLLWKAGRRDDGSYLTDWPFGPYEVGNHPTELIVEAEQEDEKGTTKVRFTMRVTSQSWKCRPVSSGFLVMRVVDAAQILRDLLPHDLVLDYLAVDVVQTKQHREIGQRHVLLSALRYENHF